MSVIMFFDKVSVFWDISDGHIILAGLEFLQGDISGETMLTYRFQFMQDSGIFEKGALSHLIRLLSIFFSFVNPITSVD